MPLMTIPIETISWIRPNWCVQYLHFLSCRIILAHPKTLAPLQNSLLDESLRNDVPFIHYPLACHPTRQVWKCITQIYHCFHYCRNLACRNFQTCKLHHAEEHLLTILSILFFLLQLLFLSPHHIKLSCQVISLSCHVVGGISLSLSLTICPFLESLLFSYIWSWQALVIDLTVSVVFLNSILPLFL